MQLVEGVAGKWKLLDKWEFNDNRLFGRDVADHQPKNVFAVWLYLSITCLFTSFYCFFVLLFGFFFLLDHSFDPRFPESGSESMDACTWIEGELILDLEKFIGGIEVGLG